MIVVSVLQMGKLRYGEVKYLFKVTAGNRIPETLSLRSTRERKGWRGGKKEGGWVGRYRGRERRKVPSPKRLEEMRPTACPDLIDESGRSWYQASL